MKDGRIIAIGVPAELKRQHKSETMEDLFLKLVGESEEEK
jgi:hypothetical protein